ncbi:MAG: hypothetical protein KKH04_05960 [Proteobacteria bacterium]|nr:hypothetical protein [Pseudomonadota bacterium]
MSAIMIFALLCVSTSVLAQSEPFEFKGITLGSDIAAIEGNSRFSCRDSNSPGADQTCSLREGETIAGAPVSALLLTFYGRKLHGIYIWFDAKHFPQVAGALKEKYGEGDLKTKEVQNRMGATFENRIYTWRKPGATLHVERFAGKLDRSSVIFRTDFAIEEFGRRRGSSAKEKAKDL